MQEQGLAIKIEITDKKKILITGGLGMIGTELVLILKKEGSLLRIADLKMGNDLRDFNICLNLCNGIDEVYHLAGIKGNPRKTKEQPVDFMGPMLQFDTNMIIAAQAMGVKKFLYTSSIAVEHPESDLYPAWAKQTAEKLIDAMRIQYPTGTQYFIARPANVYGRYDNFNNPDAMVVTSLINKAIRDKKIELYGNGETIRDFIYAKDVALGMISVMENSIMTPQNLCSGKGISIKELAEIIAKELNIKISYIKSDLPVGDKCRVMVKPNWFNPKIKIKDGIKEVIEWRKINL